MPGVADAGIPIKATVTVDAATGEVTVDLRDNPDCVPGGINLSESCATGSCLFCVFHNLDPTIPHNAGKLRVLRRQAYRREHAGGPSSRPGPVESVAVFRALERRLTHAAADAHEALARALDSAGDTASAAVVAAMAQQERDLPSGRGTRMPLAGSAAPGRGRASSALLRRAQQPLERASEIYEDLIAQAPGEALLAAEQVALAAVVERIALLAKRIEETERAA